MNNIEEVEQVEISAIITKDGDIIEDFQSHNNNNDTNKENSIISKVLTFLVFSLIFLAILSIAGVILIGLVLALGIFKIIHFCKSFAKK